jgi:hypothetical protein
MSDLAIQIHKFVLANKYGEYDTCSIENVSKAFPGYTEYQLEDALDELADRGYIKSNGHFDATDYYTFTVLK